MIVLGIAIVMFAVGVALWGAGIAGARVSERLVIVMIAPLLCLALYWSVCLIVLAAGLILSGGL